MKLAIPCLLIAAALIATPAPASPPVDPSAYPELGADALLPPILGALRHMLKDPRSIIDFTLCPPDHVKIVDGKPSRWSVSFSFNARNSYGGYDGVHIYTATFRDGRLSGPVSSDEMPGTGGFDSLINSLIAKHMAACPMIPDEQVQRIIGSALFGAAR